MVRKAQKSIERIYVALIFILLYAPIATLIVLSFNDSKIRSKWGGFTFDWYIKLFQNQEIMGALYTTLVIAVVSAFVATIIGTAGAMGISAMGKKGRSVVIGMNNIPLLNADIVTGIALMLLFIRFIDLGFSTVLLAHITFNIPYVILSVLPKLKQTNISTYEAALDLGATPVYAFRKVVFPDILPGVLTGFLLAFTMSLDDFIITYFTKGVGVNTLSTKIYAEVRKGIKPEMYALSTLLFLSVLILLFMINKRSARVENGVRKAGAKTSGLGGARKWIAGGLCVVLLGSAIAFSGYQSQSGNEVVVYNFGEYLDPQAIEMFEKETGYKVKYEEFATNEEMYPKIASGAIAYDVVCASDYMIQRMITEGLLQPLDKAKIPEFKNIGAAYLESSEEFDLGNQYAIPYIWGTVGILYNKTMVDEPIDSWSVLWDEKYKNNILMQNSVRDAFAVALKLNGHSLNATDQKELEAARDVLLKQKPLVQAYVVDEVRDKMIANDAIMGVIYSGEAITCQEENPDLEYVVPKEGSNIWIDALVMPANAKNKEGAEAFLNYMCRPEIGVMNYDYITYSTPNQASFALLDEEVQNNEIAFPSVDTLKRCETFRFLGDEMEAYYNQLWKEVKSK